MAENQYIYANARIKVREMSLLDKNFIEELLNSKSYIECMELLVNKGWGTSETTAEEMLTMEHEKTWDLIRELINDMSVFDMFLYENDFHNLKAAIKQVYMNHEIPNIYITKGTTVDYITIYEAIKQKDFSMLPDYLQNCAEEAYQVQMQTGDSQMCDIIIDKAALETIYRKGKESGIELLSDYVELKVVAANINIAIRGIKTGKNETFFQRAFVKCETLDINELTRTVVDGEDEFYKYLNSTPYADAVQAIKLSPSMFERWCDNLMINRIKPQKHNSFTLSPIIAYILARENEIKTVRIILLGKLNEISDGLIRERLRDMYV